MAQPTLFEASFAEPLHPVNTGPRRRTPPLDVPLKREVRDAIEDLIESTGPDGLSWAWEAYNSPYVDAKACIVLSDCGTARGLTLAIVCNDDVMKDTRNLRNYLAVFTRVDVEESPPRAAEEYAA